MRTTAATLLMLLATITLATACKNANGVTGTSDADSLTAVLDTNLLDWDDANAPMPIFVDNGYILHICDSQEDSAAFAGNISAYKTLVNEGERYAIAYDKFQQGQVGFGNILFGDRTRYDSGYRFKSTGKKAYTGFAFTDAFLSDHEVLQQKQFPDDENGTPAPAQLLSRLTKTYGGKVKTSSLNAQSADGKVSIYSVQFEPKDTFCMAMRVITDGDSTYIMEDATDHYDEMSAWHVDDGGEYNTIAPLAITRGKKGLDIFYLGSSPESYYYSALMVRNDSVVEKNFANYYVYVDFQPEPDPVALPKTAQLQDQLDGWKIWVNIDRHPNEDDLAGQFSVYYSKPGSDDVYLLYTTKENYDTYSTYNPDYEYVSWDNIKGGEKAWLVKDPEYGGVYAITQGCNDARNESTYLIPLPRKDGMPRWLHANSGYTGMSDDGKYIKVINYSYYEEGGRYDETFYFNFRGEKVMKE